MVVSEAFGNIISCQLSYKVGDVSKWTEELQALVGATLWNNMVLLDYALIIYTV